MRKRVLLPGRLDPEPDGHRSVVFELLIVRRFSLHSRRTGELAKWQQVRRIAQWRFYEDIAAISFALLQKCASFHRSLHSQRGTSYIDGVHLGMLC
jgi:hypothetical protein